MTDLIECLYLYTQQERLYRYLDVREYRSNLNYSEDRFNWLMTHLDEQARAKLEDYSAMRAQAQAEADAALFLGLELAHL